jgi:pyridoxamine 5'-phosphate oxidase
MTASADSAPFYDDLGSSFTKAWDVIEPGASKRTSSAHTPVVATVDELGQPQLRIMVLREASRDTRLLRFHTDVRSPKTTQVRKDNHASVLMYDPGEKLQLRLGGTAWVEHEGASVDAAWQGSTTFARRCYMAQAAPGSTVGEPTSGLPVWIEGKQPDEADLADARQNFALLWFRVASVEWLYLANSGHRRAKWMWNPESERWSGSWLVP